MENEAYAFQPPKHLAPYQEMALCLQSPLNHGPLGPCPGLKRVIEELDPLFEMIVAGYDRASYEERMPMLQKVEPSDSKLRDDDEEKDEYASALISYSNSKLDSRLARMVNNLSIDAMVILFQAATVSAMSGGTLRGGKLEMDVGRTYSFPCRDALNRPRD